MLQVVRSKANTEDANSNRYLSAIKILAKERMMDVTVNVVSNSEEYAEAVSRDVPTLVLEPCEFKGCYPIKVNAEKHQTARVIAEIIEHERCVPENPAVVILNRSDLIGKPLVKLLLDFDATPIVAHSKTVKEQLYELCYASDVIVLATGVEQSKLPLSSKIVIDVSNDCPVRARAGIRKYYSMRDVGRMTAKKMLDDVEEWWSFSNQPLI